MRQSAGNTFRFLLTDGIRAQVVAQDKRRKHGVVTGRSSPIILHGDAQGYARLKGCCVILNVKEAKS